MFRFGVVYGDRGRADLAMGLVCRLRTYGALGFLKPDDEQQPQTAAVTALRRC